MNDKRVKFDLWERTECLAQGIILLAKKIPENVITKPLISQLVRAGTSIGANYCEADNASSKKDFYYKISICKKEARETKYWLKTIAVICQNLQVEIQKLENEARELTLIFNAIYLKSKKLPALDI